MVQLEAGSAFWNSSRPPAACQRLTGRSRAISGLNMRAKNSERPIKTQRNARQRRRAEAHRHALQGGQHVPADAHVIGPVLIERIGKQGQRRVQRAQRRGKALLCTPPAAASSSTPSPNSGAAGAGELTQPARDGRRGAPDLHRRQDNHFAVRVVHATTGCLRCACFISCPTLNREMAGVALGRTRSRPSRPLVCCCASSLPAR